MDESFRQLLTNLSFISNIEIGTKPCFYDMTTTDAYSLYGSIKRKLLGEDRYRVVDFVERVVGQTIELIENENCEEIKRRLLNSLIQSKIGIINLTNTYRDSKGIIAKYQVLLDDINDVAQKYLANKFDDK